MAYDKYNDRKKKLKKVDPKSASVSTKEKTPMQRLNTTAKKGVAKKGLKSIDGKFYRTPRDVFYADRDERKRKAKLAGDLPQKKR